MCKYCFVLSELSSRARVLVSHISRLRKASETNVSRKRRKEMRKVLAIAVVVLFLTAGQAMASLTEFISYTANGAGLSIDAKGFEGSSTIRAEIPTGASVYKAFLYSADVFGGGLSNVSFEGNTLISDGSSRLDVGGRDANGASENRWDLTSAVQSKVGSGSGLFSFDLSEFGYLDGEILA